MTDWHYHETLSGLIPSVLTGDYVGALLDFYFSKCGYLKYYMPSAGITALMPFKQHGDLTLPTPAVEQLMEILLTRARRISARPWAYSNFRYHSTGTVVFTGESFILYASCQKLTNVVYMLLGMFFTCNFTTRSGRQWPISDIGLDDVPKRAYVRSSSVITGTRELISLEAAYSVSRIASVYELIRGHPARSRSEFLWKVVLGTGVKCEKCGSLVVTAGVQLCDLCQLNI